MNFLKHIILFLFIAIITAAQPVFAQESETSMDSLKDLIRVGISDNSFSKLSYDSIKLSSTGELKIWDISQDVFLDILPACTEVQITIKDSKYNILYSNGELVYSDLKGPIRFYTDKDQFITISGLKRAGKPAMYKGYFEIAKTPGKTDSFSVINVLTLTSYLKGVVPNETPVSFGLQALKAQTIAARNYAKRPRKYNYNNFDVCDSVQCQVYFGANTEHPLSNKAIEETKGLYALYNGDLILALYSSTAGGYTESYENAFSIEGTNVFPAKPIPYLKGVPDDSNTPSLDNEENARAFYSSKPETFDNNSGYFRWKREWTRDELEKELKEGLKTYASSEYEEPKLSNISDFGTLQDVKVTQRGVSGKAMFVEITTDKGKWVVKKELVIRRVFKNKGKALPSANFVIDTERNANNDLEKITFTGGGFGHGVGMSQYGSGCMASKGYTYDEILKHYYSDISIGTLPVVFNSKTPITTVYREFSIINKKGNLIIKTTDNLNGYTIKINSNAVDLNKGQKTNDAFVINVDDYLFLHENLLEIQPPMNTNKLNFKAWIEVEK